MTSQALRLAIDILQVPSRVPHVRAGRLPDGVGDVLRVATGDATLAATTAEATGRTPELVTGAASFFIEQVLLYPQADSYRVLGTQPSASPAELRHNMALLMRWLHPDLLTSADRTVYAQRIAAAWNDVKTVDRRAQYDDAHPRLRTDALAADPRGGRSGPGGASRHDSDGRARRRKAAIVVGKRRPGPLSRLAAYLIRPWRR